MRTNERGQILILTAFSMVVLMATAALSIDAGYMWDRRNILHAASDDAAKSAAIERWRSDSADITAFGRHAIGARLGIDPMTITPAPIIRACDDPAATCHAWSDPHHYVEVILGQDTNTFFGTMLGFAHLTPTVRSVAGTSASQNCLLTLNPPSGNMTIKLSGGSAVNATNCAVQIGGTLDSPVPINSPSVGAVSCSDVCAGVSQTPPPTDPLSTLPAPTSADCNNGLPGSDLSVTAAGLTITAGTYHDIQFTAPNGSNATLTLGPGIYCITGTVSVKNPGSDVTILDTGGVFIYLGPMASFDLGSNQVTVTLQAMTTGTWKGILFYQDRTNSNPITLTKNNGPYTIDGAFYAPAATVDLKNANWASSNACGMLIAGGLDFDKPNLTFDSSCFSFGGSPLSTVTLAE